MRSSAASLKVPLANTRVSVLPDEFVVVYLPLDTEPLPPEWHRPTGTRFAAIIRDAQELVVVVSKRKWLRMQTLFPKFEIEGPLKVIELFVAKPVPGYLSQLSAALLESEILAFPISSLRRNHILVQKRDLPRTVRVLRKFIEQCKAAE